MINRKKLNKNLLETESTRKIVNAFDFFSDAFDNKDDSYISRMIEIVINATCSAHSVQNESEAIQIDLFNHK